MRLIFTNAFSLNMLDPGMETSLYIIPLMREEVVQLLQRYPYESVITSDTTAKLLGVALGISVACQKRDIRLLEDTSLIYVRHLGLKLPHFQDYTPADLKRVTFEFSGISLLPIDRTPLVAARVPVAYTWDSPTHVEKNLCLT